MTIKNRFWLLVSVFLVALASTIVVNSISSTKQQAIMNDIADSLSASQSISTIARLLESNQSQILYALQYDPAHPELANSHYFPVDLYFDQVTSNAEQISQSWATYLKTKTASAIQEETDLFQAVRGEYLKTGIMGMIKLMKAGQYNDAYTYFQQQTEPLLMNARPVVDMIGNKVTERVEQLQKEADHSALLMVHIMQALVLASLVIGVLLSIYSIRIISANLNAGKSWANLILKTGELNNQVNLPHKNDEIAEMLTDVQHAFSYLNQGMQQAKQVMQAMANADFSQRMTGQYKGDLANLQEGVNGSANSISFMMSELEIVMRGLNDGHFDVQMDKKVPAAFRNLVEVALQRIHLVISDINTVMAQMNAGNFDARVKADACGNLLSMKDNANSSIKCNAVVV